MITEYHWTHHKVLIKLMTILYLYLGSSVDNLIQIKSPDETKEKKIFENFNPTVLYTAKFWPNAFFTKKRGKSAPYLTPKSRIVGYQILHADWCSPKHFRKTGFVFDLMTSS